MKKKMKTLFFIKHQNDGRMASMREMDKVLHGQLLRHQERLQYQFATPKCEETEANSKNLSEESSTSQYSSSVASSSSEHDCFGQQMSHVNEVILKAPRNIMNTSEVSTVLNRIKVNDNSATMLMSSFVKSCDLIVNDFHLSRSTTTKVQIANRLKFYIQ